MTTFSSLLHFLLSQGDCLLRTPQTILLETMRESERDLLVSLVSKTSAREALQMIDFVDNERSRAIIGSLTRMVANRLAEDYDRLFTPNEDLRAAVETVDRLSRKISHHDCQDLAREAVERAESTLAKIPLCDHHERMFFRAVLWASYVVLDISGGADVPGCIHDAHWFLGHAVAARAASARATELELCNQKHDFMESVEGLEKFDNS